MEPVQQAHMNIYQSSTYREDLGWLHFDNKSSAQKVAYVRPTVLRTCFCGLLNMLK